MNQNNRDDSIFGVIRYVANSFGLCLNNATVGSIDEPMSLIQVKQSWRQATFSCKCQHTIVQQQIYGDRAFCNTCSFIRPHQQTTPSGVMDASFKTLGAPAHPSASLANLPQSSFATTSMIDTLLILNNGYLLLRQHKIMIQLIHHHDKPNPPSEPT